MQYDKLEEGQFFHMLNFDGERKLYKSDSLLVAIDCVTGLEVKLAVEIHADLKGEVELAHIGGIKRLTVMFDLDKDELAERSSGLATAELKAGEHRRQEDYHKDMAKSEKTYAEKWESQRHKLANAVKYKQEERDATPCPEVFNYEERTASVIHPIHGEIIQVRTLEQEECTPPLIEIPEPIPKPIDKCVTCDHEDCICDNTIEFDQVTEEEMPTFEEGHGSIAIGESAGVIKDSFITEEELNTDFEEEVALEEEAFIPLEDKDPEFSEDEAREHLAEIGEGLDPKDISTEELF